MVSTPLKNIIQDGNLPQIGVKIKRFWNHQPDDFFQCIPCQQSTPKEPPPFPFQLALMLQRPGLASLSRDLRRYSNAAKVQEHLRCYCNLQLSHQNGHGHQFGKLWRLHGTCLRSFFGVNKGNSEKIREVSSQKIKTRFGNHHPDFKVLFGNTLLVGFWGSTPFGKFSGFVFFVSIWVNQLICEVRNLIQ